MHIAKNIKRSHYSCIKSWHIGSLNYTLETISMIILLYSYNNNSHGCLNLKEKGIMGMHQHGCPAGFELCNHQVICTMMLYVLDLLCSLHKYYNTKHTDAQ